MFFGSYLVTKKLITVDSLLKALIEQQESSESSLKITVSHKNISEDNVLAALNYQAKESCTFLKACLDLNLLSIDEANEIREKISNSRSTLGEILVRGGGVNAEDLEKAHAEFNALLKEEPAQESKKVEPEESSISDAALESLRELGHDTSDLESSSGEKSNSTEEGQISAAALESLKELGHDVSDLESLSSNEPSKETEPETQINAAALESLKELGHDVSGLEAIPEAQKSDSVEPSISSAALESLKEIGGVSEEELKALEKSSGEANEDEKVDSNTFITEYLDTFNEKLNKKLMKVVNMIYSTAENKSDVANFFNTLYRELHVVKGVACLAEAKITEKLISMWEVVIEDLFKKDNDFLVKWVNENLNILEDSIEIIWIIRNSIESTNSEVSFWSDKESKARYTDNMKKIKELSVI